MHNNLCNFDHFFWQGVSPLRSKPLNERNGLLSTVILKRFKTWPDLGGDDGKTLSNEWRCDRVLGGLVHCNRSDHPLGKVGEKGENRELPLEASVHPSGKRMTILLRFFATHRAPASNKQNIPLLLFTVSSPLGAAPSFPPAQGHPISIR
jgi:hypothetical protein